MEPDGSISRLRRAALALPLFLFLALAGCAGSGGDGDEVIVEGQVADASTAPASGVQAWIAFFESDGMTPVLIDGTGNVLATNPDGTFRTRLPPRLSGKAVEMIVSTSMDPAADFSEPSELLVIVPVATDSYVDDSAADVNFGSAADLLVSAPVAAAATRWTLLRFDISGLDGTLLEARLQLLAQAGFTDGGDVQLLSDASWNETTVTWNTRPALAGVLGPVGGAAADDVVSVEVTAAIGAALGAASDRIALALTDAQNPADLLSKEGAIGRNRPDLLPRLYLLFEGPGAPAPGSLRVSRIAVIVDGAPKNVFLSNTAVSGEVMGSNGAPAASVDILLEQSDGAGGWMAAATAEANPGATDPLGHYAFALPGGGAGDYRLTFAAADPRYTELRTPSFPVATGGRNVQPLLILEALDTGGGPGGSGVSFSRDVQPVFNANCSCHLTASGAPQGESLLAGVSYRTIVGVPSTEVPGLNRIEPGQPDQSYLIIKVDDSSPNAGLRAGDRMPRGLPPLDPAEIAALRQWVAEGALDN